MSGALSELRMNQQLDRIAEKICSLTPSGSQKFVSASFLGPTLLTGFEKMI